MTATLIVSLSGLAESTFPETLRFAEELDARSVPVSWLLAPRPTEGRHRPDDPLIHWLRRRLEAGDALVMHGFDHTSEPIGRWATGPMARIGRRAEFAALPRHEATLRLIAATRTMDELRLPSEVFAPPRWVASPGTLAALRRRGFLVCADCAGVRRLGLPGPEALLRGRVLTPHGTAAPGASESWRHRTLVASAARIARRGGLVRIAGQGEELRRPAVLTVLLDAVDTALAAGAVPASYRLPVADPARLTA